MNDTAAPGWNDIVQVRQCDIVTLRVAAIVNAANHTLLGGGGVDGAIHRAAGPELLAFCRTLHGCATGEAKITPAFRLPASHVIHTVGPVWRGGADDEDALLASCYRRSLQLAREHGLTSIAFPAISTGVYGFPPDAATAIALRTVISCLQDEPAHLTRVVFACFDARMTALYASHLARLRAGT